MILRAVLMPLKDTKGIASIKTIEAKFLKLIAQHMGFSYESMLSVDGQFGVPRPDGNWTGIIGMIQRDEADLSVAHLAMTEHRLQVIDFSESYWMEAVTFMTELPPLLPKTYFYTYPFTFCMWLAIVAVMIVTTFFSVPREGFGAVMLTALRGLCRQSVNVKSARMNARQLLLGHWLYFANFVTMSYCAVLLSFLTVPLRHKGVETIDDLCRAVKEGSYKALVPMGSSIQYYILRSENENLQELGRAILSNHWQFDTTQGIENYFEYGTALIDPIIRFTGVTFSGRFISKDAFGTSIVGVALNRRFCCKKRLNLLIRRISAAGLYQKIIEEEGFKAGLGQQNSLTEKNLKAASSVPLSIDDLYGVFAILVAGYIAAGVALLLELVWNYV